MKIISKNALLSFLFLTNIILSQNRWEFVNPKPTGFDLHSIKIDSEQNVWLVGEYGTILKSNDNCESWKPITLNYTDNLYDLSIVNEKIWIVGQNGRILFSNDQGLTWDQQISNTNKSLLKIQFIDEIHGWIIASDSLVLRTIDGGNNWLQTFISNKWSQNDIMFLNKDIGFLLTGYFNEPNLDIEPWTAGALFKTIDGGLSWDKLESGSTKYSSIYFLNDKIGFMSIHNNELGRMFLKTTDSGFSWDTLSYSSVFEKMYFTDEQNGIAIGGSSFTKTIDGGINWETKTDIKTPSLESRLTGLVLKNSNILLVGTEGNILRSTDLGENWSQLNSSINFYYASLRGIIFNNESVGYIYGGEYLESSESESILLKTEDKGSSWNRLNSPNTDAISLLKTHDNILWASSGTRLFRSDNDGETWADIIDISNNGDWLIRQIEIVDSKKIIFLGGRRIYTSNDGGNSWTYTNEFGVQFLKQIVLITDNKWILLGHTAATEPNYITTDGGAVWTELNYSFTSMQFINENIGYAIYGGLYKTIDSGNSWEMINESVNDIAFWTSKLFFYDETVGWLNSSDYLYYTKDGGLSWVKEYGIKDILNWSGPALSIKSETEAWAVGSNGHILKLTSNGVSGSYSFSYDLPEQIILYQNYPNPFNPSTSIQFSISHYGKVTLKVYDVLGKEISVLLDDYLETGTHNLLFNPDNLASGIYFYRLTFDNFAVTKKLMFIK
ncbi:MAG: T9SS type A sorting domain-containing protein [Bacteroidetes bacterium]|nr:T9SS type A sorting domain-containing protein [Bacteroidota bacterium]